MLVTDALRQHAGILRNSRLEVPLAAALLVGSAVIGLYYGVTLLPDLEMDRVGAAAGPGTFLRILLTNVPAALLLYSGVATLGVTGLVAGAGIGLYLGHSIALSVAVLGPGQVIAHSFLYTPLEVYGFVLALAAGLTPLSFFVDLRMRLTRDSIAATVRRSLGLLTASIVVLFVAALLETTNIFLTR